MNAEAVPGRTDRKRIVTAAIKETAAQLGNTPAVCKASYIWPSVLRDFERGRVLRPYYRTLDELVQARSHAAERALVELLKTGRSAIATPGAAPSKKARPREMPRSAAGVRALPWD